MRIFRVTVRGWFDRLVMASLTLLALAWMAPLLWQLRVLRANICFGSSGGELGGDVETTDQLERIIADRLAPAVFDGQCESERIEKVKPNGPVEKRLSDGV